MSTLFDLTGKVALITGAGQGVGQEIARTLALQGASVAINDLNEERASKSATSIPDGARAIVVPGDVTDAESIAAMVAKVENTFGPVDILVNNAGIPADGMIVGKFVDSSPADWDPYVRLNFYGVLKCTHAVLRGMTDRGWGRIVTIVSDAGRVGEANQAVYAASKAAAAGFSRSLAKEVGKLGVTSNCVALGSIQVDYRPQDPERLAKKVRFYPVGRLGRPTDVAAAVAWLVSEEAGWVTGQTVPVNGGYSTS